MSEVLEDLTVFIISCAEDTLDDCLEALKAQDCEFRIEHIQDVTPMSKAFQSMPDRAETPYFIQVDADMILEPFAVRKLYEAAKKTGIFTAAVYGQLYEEGFGIGGSIRCWKATPFKFFSFQDCRTVDRNFYKRSKWFFRRKSINEVLGVHRPRHSRFSEYLKTKSDIEKWRFLKRPSSKYALPLYDQLQENLPESSDLFLGLLVGALTQKHIYERSKDWQHEKMLHQRLFEGLALAPEALQITADAVTPELRQCFATCYDDFQNQNTKALEALTSWIIQTLKVNPDELSAQNFYPMISQ